MATDPRTDRAEELSKQAERELEQGNIALALMSARQVLALMPGEPRYHELLGRIYQRAGKEVLAQKSFASARALAPGAPPQPEPEAARAAAPSFSQEPEVVEAPLTAVQRRLLLDGALHCLTRISATEERLRQAGLEGSDIMAGFQATREELAARVREARDTWRTEHQAAPPAVPGSPAGAAAPAPIPAAYRAIPPFTRTLGTIPGASIEGPDVRHLQELLGLEGFHVPVTGHFDRSTSLAVSKLQERYGLKKHDGIVSVETRQLLNQLTGHLGTSPLAKPKYPGIKVADDTHAAFNRLAQQRGTGPL